MALVVLGWAAGCGSSGAATGTALTPGATTSYGLATLKPGTQLGLLDVDLVNRSQRPVTLESVSGIGRGLGTVIRVVKVKIAPVETGNKGTPGGPMRFDPPVAWWPPTWTCGKQVLRPLRGFRPAPAAWRACGSSCRLPGPASSRSPAMSCANPGRNAVPPADPDRIQAPGRELAQVQRIRLPGQAAVPGEEAG
jgi:hypothetical protein